MTVVLPDGRRLIREVQAGSSYLSSEDPRPHFGLGSATTVSELIVRFPNGSTTRLHDVAADRLVTVRPEPWRMEGCSPVRTERSVARIWNEAILDAIRRDIPAPTTHARNLFHVSAAMWDAWAAYDPKADGYFVTEKLSAARRAGRTGDGDQLRRLPRPAVALRPGRRTPGDVRRAHGHHDAHSVSDPTSRRREAVRPAALGNRIAAAVIEAGRSDGSLEAQHYADESYVPVNEPLVVKRPGTTMHDATFWQPLALDQVITQNNVELPGKVQVFIGAQWGRVRGFALPPSRNGVPIDPGAPPIGLPEDTAYKQAAVDVIRLSSELDPSDGQLIDIGLDKRGDNPLGTNDGNGYAVNPVTGAAVRRESRPPGRLRARSRRVLGRWPEFRDAARALEHDRQHGLRLASARRPHRAGRRKPTELGRPPLLRARRRGARRRHRGLGSQTEVPVGAADLDDPLPGRQRAVERSDRALV